MTGWPQNAAPNALMNVDVDAAARALAAVLDAEDADIVTGYDWHGGYGHPDHVMVHRIVRRAVELAARRPRLLEVTMNRDALRAMVLAVQAAGLNTQDWDPDGPGDDGNPIGTRRPSCTCGWTSCPIWSASVAHRLDLRPGASRQVLILRS